MEIIFASIKDEYQSVSLDMINFDLQETECKPYIYVYDLVNTIYGYTHKDRRCVEIYNIGVNDVYPILYRENPVLLIFLIRGNMNYDLVGIFT